MERRIFGLENEYGVTCTLRGQRRLSPDEVARYLFRRVVSWGRSSNVFLANGARLYLDVGSHPEYATPECDDLVDLVVHDKAGERILEQLLASAEQRLREEGIRGVIYLFKNNTDSAGNSYGCHENYLTSRRDDFGHYAEVLIPFLVTPPDLRRRRQGAPDRPGRHVLHEPSGPSTSGRASARPPPAAGPIINTRDEPHADAERYRRLHVIVGDSNMSEYATFLKVGDDGDPAADARGPQRRPARHDPREPDPGHPRDQPRHHLHPHRSAWPTAARLSALEIQPEYLDRAIRYAERQGFPPQEQRALEMWEHVMNGIEKDPLSLDRECDWVIKHNLIEALPRAARPAAESRRRSP